MRMLGRWIGTARLAGLALLGGLLALRVLDPAPVSALRFTAFDLFQQIAPRPFRPAPVAIIDIDDASLAELGQWPWPRTLMAEMIRAAAGQGAAVIGLDIVFAEPDRLSPDRFAADHPELPDELRAALREAVSNDAALAQAMAQARVVVGQTSVRSASPGATAPAAAQQVPHAVLGPDPAAYLPAFPDLVENLPPLEAAAAGRGVFTVRPDADGIYRRVPLVLRVQGALRLALTPELLRVATGGQAFAVRVNEAGVDSIVVGGQRIRTAGDGTVWPWFGAHAPARFVSAADLIGGRVPPGRLAGHLVLVGTSAIGLEDYRPTPLGVSMAGVEIHAQLLENILAGTLLQRPNYAIAVELVTLALLGLLVIALVPAIAGTWVLVLAAVTMAGYAGLSWWSFTAQRLLLDPTWPILGTLAILMLMSTANYLREERDRRRIRTAFGQYVSPELVDQLQESPDRLVLGGERRELTILFSDVRGFTTLAESFRDDPAGLTALMNTFLSVLSRAILDSRGTIDKFMGDAVMAFWNAPLDLPEHALAGCRAALRMRADIAELNARRAQDAAARGEVAQPIDVGIGLNSGACTVGNMGSDMRFDYTCLGDAVNLASRLEGQSKTYGVGIVLGAATAVAVADRLAVFELDLLRVKGKTAPERVFALLGDETLRADPGFAAAAATARDMRTAYRARDWDAADTHLALLEDLEARRPLGLSGFIALYRARVAAFRAAPPPPDWDGVTTAETK